VVEGDTATAFGAGFTAVRVAEEGAVESLHDATATTSAATAVMDSEDLDMRHSGEGTLFCETAAGQWGETPGNTK